jgi:glycosyltransferase involved in cell wall biosynthesis
MSSRPNILFLSQCLPYPPHAGGITRPYNIAKQLQKEFDVHLLAFYRVNHQPDAHTLDSAREALRESVSIVHGVVPITSEHSRTRKLRDHLRSLVTQRAYSLFQHQSSDFRAILQLVLESQRPDLVHMASIDLHGWLGDLPPVPTTCTHQDIESHLMRQRAESFTSPILRWYVRRQADFVEKVERVYCPDFAANVVMSKTDSDRLGAVAPGSKMLVVPNGVDTEYFRPTGNAESIPDRVVFAGPTYSFANRDAVDFFLTDVWPTIRAGRRTASLELIGRSPAGDRARFSRSPGVTCLGYVPDARPHLAQACCSVVPIRFGGGTRLKILDAWAMGKAVVSTSVGCEGLQAVDGENILIRDTSDGMAAAVLDILKDENLRERLGSDGRRTVQRLYSWDVVGQRLRQGYRELLGG